MNILSKSVLIALALGTIFLQPALAKQPLLFVYNEYPPYEFMGHSNHTGTSIDKIREIAAEANVEIKFANVPWSRALKMMKTGEADAIFSLFKTEKRKSFLNYVDTPLGKVTDIAVSLAGSKVNIEKFSDLRKYRIGVIKDNSHGPIFDKLSGLNKDVSMTNDIHLIRKLRGKRVDAIIITKAVFEYLLRKEETPLSEFKIQPLVINNENLHVAFSKKLEDSAQLAALFNETLKKLH